ncbi:hypothetical protein KC330_g1589 [Hortaea werneckii]|nr:hypothetical protein KC330_g1589 [Hortaea werneckii]
MNVIADQGSSMEQQKSTDVLLMELMGLALGWEFEGASEHRALVKYLYQAAQEERKAANSRFLHLSEKQALCEKEIDSLRAKLANIEAATEDSQHAETGKNTLNEVERDGNSRGKYGFMLLCGLGLQNTSGLEAVRSPTESAGHWCAEQPFKFCEHLI